VTDGFVGDDVYFAGGGAFDEPARKVRIRVTLIGSARPLLNWSPQPLRNPFGGSIAAFAASAWMGFESRITFAQ